jgi:hypothetical protein
MQRLLGYALAFGAGIGAGKILLWKPVSTGHQHGEQTPGSKMTIKGIDFFLSGISFLNHHRTRSRYGCSNGGVYINNFDRK